jgi:tetratricopeptide (TPR) repeat protein
MSTRSRIFVLAALAAFAAPASADPSAAQPHIDRATALHKESKFAEALDELKLAYALDAQPNLLYAIAQVHVKLGRCTDAIAFYEKFLAAKPDAGPASAARQAIEVCKTNPPPPEVTPEPTPPPPPPEPTPPAFVMSPPPPVAGPEPLYADPIGGVLVGAGVISGVVAIVMYRGATSDLDDAEMAATYQESEKLVDSGHSKRTYAAIATGGAVALIAAGVVHMVVRDRGGQERTVALTPSTGGAVITWGGHF